MPVTDDKKRFFSFELTPCCAGKKRFFSFELTPCCAGKKWSRRGVSTNLLGLPRPMFCDANCIAHSLPTSPNGLMFPRKMPFVR
jgi:hypothetical protein